MAEMLIVKSKIKELVKDCNVAGDFADGLNEVVIELVKKAEKRAVDNGRKTLQVRDL